MMVGPRALRARKVTQIKKIATPTISKYSSPSSIVKTQYQQTGQTPAQFRQRIKASTTKFKRKDIPKVMKSVGVNSFPGRIKNSTGEKKYIDGQIGRFTQSIKGMKPKYFVEKGITAAIAQFEGME